MVYIVGFVFDFVTLILRLIEYESASQYYDYLFAILIINATYVFMDIMQIVTTLFETSEIRKFKDDLFIAFATRISDTMELESIFKTSGEIFRNRGIARSLAIADIILASIIFIIYGLGLNINVEFGRVTFLQIINLVLWVGGLAISVSMHNRDFVKFMSVAYGVSLALLIGSLVLRFISIQSCLTEGISNYIKKNLSCYPNHFFSIL
jgi:hypothetical protein